MMRVIASDWLKIRGRGVWLLALLGPLGVMAIQALNFGLRLDYMKSIYAGHLWEGLLEQTMQFVPMTLLLGSTLICSLIAGIEHQTGAWKQLLALPVSRISVFVSKLLLALMLLSVSCLLLPVFMAALGLLLGFPAVELPVIDLLRTGFPSFAAALPFTALQLWLSLVSRNQSLAVSVGVITAIMSPFLTSLPEWVPTNWVYYAWSEPGRPGFAGAGMALGLLLLIPGAVHFGRKDVS